jgi:hypothetical protein
MGGRGLLLARTLPLKNLKRNRLGLDPPITAPFTLSVLDEPLCADRLERTEATYTATHHECGGEERVREESSGGTAWTGVVAITISELADPDDRCCRPGATRERSTSNRNMSPDLQKQSSQGKA